MNQIITDAVFRKKIETSPVGAYLFFGDEDYLKAFTMKTAVGIVCPDPALAVFNNMTVDPSVSDDVADAIASAISAAPMMAETKAVTVSGLSINDMKQKEVEALCAAAATVEEFDYNLLIVSIPAGMLDEGNLPKKPSPVLSKLSEVFTPVHFPKIEPKKLESWIVRHFEHNGLKVEMGVPAAMIERCGADMFTLSGEIEKLSAYTKFHGREAVSLEDLPTVTCLSESYDAFALGNAIARGDTARALDVLGLMKARRIDPIIISAELSKSLGDMLAVKILADAKVPLPDIAKGLKMREYAAKLAAASVKNASVDTLRQAVEACVSADLALKSSANGYMELEKLVCSLNKT